MPRFAAFGVGAKIAIGQDGGARDKEAGARRLTFIVFRMP